MEQDVHEVVSTVTETAGEGEPTVELPIVEEPDAILEERPASETVEPASEVASKPKVRRKKNVKSDDK